MIVGKSKTRQRSKASTDRRIVRSKLMPLQHERDKKESRVAHHLLSSARLTRKRQSSKIGSSLPGGAKVNRKRLRSNKTRSARNKRMPLRHGRNRSESKVAHQALNIASLTQNR